METAVRPAPPASFAQAPDVARVRALADRVRANVNRVIIGKPQVIDRVLAALLCEGHVLLEDVPGLGKTVLARALAQSLACSFARIQFTPDLLPSDVTGLSVYNQQQQEFQFRPGPVFTQVLLADEINRATPRTQSALLEAMAERTTTVDGRTMPLPRPFLVLATQNPIELEGTFPLPEAQLDRFLIRLRVGYPDAAEEEAILQRFERANPLADLPAAATADELLAAQTIIRTVEVTADVRRYVVAIVRATRGQAALDLGASPRGTLALYRSAQAQAAMQGRTMVTPDDVKAMAPYVLPHRLILNPEARLRNRDLDQLVLEILTQVPVPVEPMPSV
ncbi:MAG TPA: MoxR family ATPase [Chloroflexia bacterium]|nr:MoxR family ATPase [Chloroflexia bacterium]